MSITVKNAGEYIAKVPSPCGFIRDTINLFNYHQLKQPNLGEDTTICINTSINLEVDAKATYILWSTKETSHKIKTDTAGLYTVIIANPCDTLRDTIRLNYHPKTKFLTTISDDTAKVLDSIHFKLLLLKISTQFNGNSMMVTILLK